MHESGLAGGYAEGTKTPSEIAEAGGTARGDGGVDEIDFEADAE